MVIDFPCAPPIRIFNYFIQMVNGRRFFYFGNYARFRFNKLPGKNNVFRLLYEGKCKPVHIQIRRLADMFHILFGQSATKLQAGAYQIDGGMSNQQIVDVMVKGRIKQVRFTVPEGYSVAKTAKKLEAEGLGSADKFMAAAKDYAPYPYMQTDDSNVLFKAEGFIYPATYDFPVGISEQEMLKMMVAQFDKEMQSSGIAKTVAERNLPLRDVVNMASMVELEAVFAEEQPHPLPASALSLRIKPMTGKFE